MSKSIATGALALAFGTAALSPSVAQTQRPCGIDDENDGCGCPMMGMVGQGMMGGRQAGMDAVDCRLAYLQDELKITDVQIGPRNDYVEAVKGRVNVMPGMRKGMMDAMQQGSAVERMDARIKGMKAMVEAMKAIEPSTVRLYAALTAEQKKIAD